MSEVILRRIVETCPSCPAQWNAWDIDGSYWYLRYRGWAGTAERQPSPDYRTWEDKPPNITFDGRDSGQDYSVISLAAFLRLAGLNLHPRAELVLMATP